jgi:hypothetical protein
VDLVQVSRKDGSVGNVLGRLGKLEQHNAGADGQETVHHGDDGGRGALEAAEQDSGADDGGAGKVNIVRGRNQGSVEQVKRFLWKMSANTQQKRM